MNPYPVYYCHDDDDDNDDDDNIDDDDDNDDDNVIQHPGEGAPRLPHEQPHLRQAGTQYFVEYV